MPVIINSENIHPFLPSLGSPSAIDKLRAERQDIRPLEIAIINLMADKQTTERQLAQWLGHTPLQICLTFATTDSYVQEVRNGRETVNTPTEHIKNFYNAWSDIKHNKYDALILTGVNALKPRVEQEEMWPEVQAILDWSETNVFSSLFLCWGAKAALKHFHNIDSFKPDKKLWGVFPHTIPSDKTNLLFGFPDIFPLPVSRWKSPSRADIEKCPVLEIVADSTEAGPNVLVETDKEHNADCLFQRRIYVLAHPEYDTETLSIEHKRDTKLATEHRVPANYYPDDNPTLKPLNTWRFTAHLYTNWLHTVYEATPYDQAQIPAPCKHKTAQR